MKVKRLRRIAAPALFAALAFGPISAHAIENIKVGIAGTSSDIVFFIADANGYLRDEGLDADLVPFASATQMVAPLGVGELDVGGGGPSAGLYNAAVRKVDIKIVADKGSMPKGYGFFSLLVRKDLIDSGKVKAMADLKGMKIGDTSKQGSGDVTLSHALAKSGLKWDDVEQVYLGAAQLAAALKSGAIDASLIQEPSMSVAIADGAAVLFAKGDEIYPDQQLATTFFSEKLMTTKRDVAQRFMNAYVRAARFYNDALKDGRLAGPNADEVIDLMVANTNLKDRARYKTLVPNGLNPDGCANAAGLRDDFHFYAAMGWVDKSFDPDKVVDDSFCKAAVAKLGPYVPAK